MTKNAVIITGVSGGLGNGLYQAFHDAGFFVIGVDRKISNLSPSSSYCEFTIDVDELVDSPAASTQFRSDITTILDERDWQLKCLVNNAAVQLLGSTDTLTQADFRKSLLTNLEVPLTLTLMFKDALAANQGSVINIGSIHSSLTKPGFISYATSKSALLGLTQSLAIDFGGEVRVNSIRPAAIRTPMLEAGFEGRPEKLKELEAFHPSGRVGEPIEVGEMAVFLASDKSRFVNGADLSIDGGIGARLHDPV